ncbi:hypothetical protein HBB16_15365 [Pseudonocardia sp. MCCB 268]|nr:hypothetical protein [Pseudonocardia cytotoxica]
MGGCRQSAPVPASVPGRNGTNGNGSSKIRGYSAGTHVPARPLERRVAELARARPRDSYDVVIIGGTGWLRRTYPRSTTASPTSLSSRRPTSAAVDRGATLAILRSNYLTPRGRAVLRPLREAVRAPRRRPELQRHVLPAARVHMTLAHNDSSLRTMRWRAEEQGPGRRPGRDRAGQDQKSSGPTWTPRTRGIRSWGRFPTTRRAASSGTTRWSGGGARRGPARGAHPPKTKVTGIDVVGGRVTGV